MDLREETIAILNKYGLRANKKLGKNFLINESIIYDIVKKEKYLLTIYKHAPYSLIPFVISMFLIVVSLKENGVLEVISNILVKATNNNNFVETKTACSYSLHKSVCALIISS